MVMPGAMAISLYPDIPDRDMVFPTLVTRALPAGLTGLVLAGLIAAIMSSVDSTLNSSSTLVVHDFLQKPDRDLSPEASRRYGRLTTIVIMGIAIAWAPMIESFAGLWSYLQQAFAIVVPPVAAVFLAGAFSRTVNGRGALLTLAIGHGLGVVLFVAREAGWWPVHFTITVFLSTLVSLVLLFALSRLGERPSEQAIKHGVWRPEIAFPNNRARGLTGLLTDLRTQAIIVLAGMAATLFAFW
jgi:SSS family solute:Na+ symporter